MVGLKKWLVTMLVVAPMAALAGAPGVTWEQTLAAAKRRAQAEHKVILLDLWAEWCGPCQGLKRNVFPTPTAQAALKGVVPLEAMVETVDGKPMLEGVALAKQFGLRAYPSLFILDAQGKVLRSHVGYLTPKELELFIHGA